MTELDGLEQQGRADANTVAGAVLSIPVPVVAKLESRAVVLTKFFSWLTACLFATAVTISLISITSERNDLRNQLDDQNSGLVCRYAAGAAVNEASAKQQIAIVKHSVLIGDFVRVVINTPKDSPEYLTSLADIATKLKIAGSDLDKAGDNLLDAVVAQKLALEECQKS